MTYSPCYHHKIDVLFLKEGIQSMSLSKESASQTDSVKNFDTIPINIENSSSNVLQNIPEVSLT